jgi:hypothetical protein
MALQIKTITDSISLLAVKAAQVRDLDEIPETAGARLPLIFPRPDGFVSDFTMVRDSYGGGSTAMMTVEYNLNYRLCYAPVNVDRGLFAPYPEMVQVAFAFLDAVLAVDTMDGLIDITPADITSFGPVPDPAGNMYHGCDITLHIKEFVN